MSRRALLAAGGTIASALAGAALVRYNRRLSGGNSLFPSASDWPAPLPANGRMPMRSFGSTGLVVSEIGFGAWGIGGNSYGTVAREDALQTLAKAEELGCNFVDTAAVYGVSEELLGEFLQGRRSRWIIATKFSGQPEGLTATVERQLARLRTDVIDYYQFHFYPRGKDEPLFDEVSRLRKAGKIRFVGVSLYTQRDIDDAMKRPDVDGIQLEFSLLGPDPFLSRARTLRKHNKAVIVRSALKEGFLTGKFKRTATFPDTADQRHTWTREQIERTVDNVERFRFLEREAGSMVRAAAGYPLSFPQVSTVLLGTKNVAQAASNFGDVPGMRFSQATLARVNDLQVELGVGDRVQRWMRRLGFA